MFNTLSLDITNIEYEITE